MKFWLAALGAPPVEGPMQSPLGGFYGYDVDRPDLWPPRGVGAQRAVFWLRWWQDKLVVEGMDEQKATSLHKQTQRELQASERQVMAIHPDTGEEYSPPAYFWQSNGDPIRSVSWSSQWWMQGDNETPGDLYMIEPDARPRWLPGERQSLKSWCDLRGLADTVARERLKALGNASPSESAVCAELSQMWGEAGREGGSPGTIYITRKRMR